MKNNPRKSLAKQHPFLLVYTLLNLTLTLITLFLAFKVTHDAYAKYFNSNSGTSNTLVSIVLYLLLGFIWGILIYIYTYLLFSKNVKKVVLILKVLLGLYLIGVLFSRTLSGLLIDVIEAGSTFVALRYIGGQYKEIML